MEQASSETTTDNDLRKKLGCLNTNKLKINTKKIQIIINLYREVHNILMKT